MLKANRRMKINTNMLLFNGAGVLVGLIVAGYSISAYFHEDVVPACTARYPTAVQLALDNTKGGVMSPIELQARAGIDEWGVLENAKVVRVADAPAPSVLEVKLAKTGSASVPHAANLAGFGMNWAPAGLSGANAACLGYSVFLPENFDFGDGGSLPGIFGGARPEPARHDVDASNGFFARPRWVAGGGMEIEGRFAGGPTGIGQSFGAEGQPFPLGRWVRVEQEVVLNVPGQTDGLVRLWVDGKLRVDIKDVPWRATNTLQIAGVVADVSARSSVKPVSLRVSPPVLGWTQ